MDSTDSVISPRIVYSDLDSNEIHHVVAQFNVDMW